MTARLDLSASRNVAWGPIVDLFYPGEDLPLDGAHIDMEVRLYPGAPGSPIASITAIAFEDLAPEEVGQQRRLRIYPRIPQGPLAAFPSGLNNPDPGEADAYSYDIILTYADAAQDKLALGSFLLEPGVTRP